MLSFVEKEILNCWYSEIYNQDKFHAKLNRAKEKFITSGSEVDRTLS